MSSKKNCETIPFSVVHVTSEHDRHLGTYLSPCNADTSGWLSADNCSFPQHVIIKLDYASKLQYSLSQIKVLTHETKIPKRIEIFLASQSRAISSSIQEASHPNWNDSAINFDRLGFVSFDSNERSSYRARELKSIKLGGVSNVSFIKLALHECHHNEFNPTKQVGIVSITVLGEVIMTIKDKSERRHPDQSVIVAESTQSIEDILKIDHGHDNEGKGYRNSRVYSDLGKSSMGHVKRLEAVMKINLHVETEVKQRIESLEKIKMMRAAIEDYDGAARVKDILARVRGLYESFQSLHREMQRAAKEEDYQLASRLKEQRDEARERVLDAIDEVDDVRSDYSSASLCQSTEQDLSLSTISGELPLNSRTHQETNAGTIQCSVSWNNEDENSYEGKDTHVNTPGAEENIVRPHESMNDTNFTGFFSGLKAHPLHGVIGYEDLPTPEELSFDDGNASPEAFQKIEPIMGSYVAKCFFSKHWSLRDAALQKTTMVLPSIRDQINKEVMFKGLIVIAERALEDRIVQVVLTALFFLDTLITEFEKGGMVQKDAIPLLTPIVLNLISKLGYSKPKVVDTAEKALMSFALSTCIGPSCIAHHLIKRTNMKDVKGGKAMVTRFIILRQLMEDFDLVDGPSSERVLEWIRDCGMNHKEGDVRDAAKDLSVSIFLRDGDRLDVLSILEGLTERQVKEYKIAFATAKNTRVGRGKCTRQQYQIEQRVTFGDMYRSDETEDVDHLSKQKNLDDITMVRGRGRGRGRASAQPQLQTDNVGMRTGKHVNLSWPVAKDPRNLTFDQEDESDPGTP